MSEPTLSVEHARAVLAVLEFDGNIGAAQLLRTLPGGERLWKEALTRSNATTYEAPWTSLWASVRCASNSRPCRKSIGVAISPGGE